MRAARIVRRVQEKKSMKNRIKNLRIGMRVGFEAGRESVLMAAHNLSYGEGYEVSQAGVGGSTVQSGGVSDAGGSGMCAAGSNPVLGLPGQYDA